MKKILIIGANGYFGSELLKYLNYRNFTCVGTDINYFKNCNFYKKKNDIIETCASKLKSKFLVKFDIVLLFAGYSNNPLFKKNEKNFHKKEYKFIKKITDICKKNHINLIYPSSCSLYGRAKNKKFLRENDETNPVTHYSINKKKAEDYLLKTSNSQFKPIILRFATLYGLSQKMRFDLVVNMFCGSGLIFKKIELNSDGKVFRPFIEISDACLAIYKVIINKTKIKNQIFNVGSNEDNIKIIDLAEKIKKKIINSNIKFLDTEKKLVSDNLIKNKKDKRNYKVNFDKFSNTFNFKVKYNLNRGINKLLDDLKKHKLNKSKFYSTKYYRLQYLQELCKKNILSKSLNFRI